MYTSLPQKFQIRNNCIISYQDYSYLDSSKTKKCVEKPNIIQSGTYTESAKKRLKKCLDIWTYSYTGLNVQFSFITLTISSKYKSEIDYYTYLKQFIEIITYRYKNVNYAWKLELQENGNPHYHLLFDTEIQWKTVRKQWNKIQSIHVDEYQIKMKSKYRNGYYFDNTMVDKNGNTVSEEIQEKRFKIGYKANWRNPNSTDVKIENNLEAVQKYISKYINKTENENKTITYNSNRWCGTSDSLKLIKYATIEEISTDIETLQKLSQCYTKIIEKENRYICTIHDKINTETIKKAEQKTIEENRKILHINQIQLNEKLIKKDAETYTKLFVK